MTHFGRPGLPFQNATGRHKLTRETLSVTATLTFYVAYCIHYPTTPPSRGLAAARIGSASLVMYPYVGCCIYHLTHLTEYRLHLPADFRASQDKLLGRPVVFSESSDDRESSGPCRVSYCRSFLLGL